MRRRLRLLATFALAWAGTARVVVAADAASVEPGAASAAPDRLGSGTARSLSVDATGERVATDVMNNVRSPSRTPVAPGHAPLPGDTPGDGPPVKRGRWSCADVGPDTECLARSAARDPEFAHPWTWAPSIDTSDPARHQLALRKLDLRTGRFFDGEGCPPDHCIVIDPDTGAMGSNGPDIGRSKAGFTVFYNGVVRQGGRDRTRIFRTSQLGEDPDRSQIVTTLVTRVELPGRIQDPLASQVCDSDEIGLIFSEEGRGTVYGMLERIEAGYAEGVKDLPYPHRGKKAWWMPDGFDFVYVADVSSAGIGATGLQVVRVDARTGASRVLTRFVGDEIGAVIPFRAVEHGGEPMLAVITVGSERNELVTFRDTGQTFWPEQSRIAFPDEFPFVANVDVVRAQQASCHADGSAPRLDRTYLAVFANKKGTQPGRDSLTTHAGSSIWLLSLDGSVRCRVDRHVAELKRYDPELLLLRNRDTKTDDLHVVFSHKDEQATYRMLHFVDTGLRFPYQD